MLELPSGTVTFLFTDIEESTQLWERHPRLMQHALSLHDSLIYSAVEDQGGTVVKNTGDGFYAVFPSPEQGLRAAVDGQRRLQTADWDQELEEVRVRMGLHTGTAKLRGKDYFGRTVNRAARICAAAHGGQIVLSSTTQALVADQLTDDFHVTDLGEHQLKGLASREHIYQLDAPDLPANFPALRTDTPLSNLPALTTSFLGRKHHRTALVTLLRRDDVRLVTLTGPGGTGKTRLSLAVAEDLLTEFADGVTFVELATTDDPQEVIPAIATALKVKSSPRTPTREALGYYLRDRQVLLVLDNFEHIVAAGPQIAGLLTEALNLKVLVTSREILHIYGEHEYPLPPLELPTEKSGIAAAVLAQNEAVSLFCQRARAATPEFLLNEETVLAVVAICRQLDGLPLAIELAAARTRILTLDALLRRLDKRLRILTDGPRDAPARQRTVRDTIDWSYGLLDAAQKQLFARLSVFVGGWSLEAAEEACGDDEQFDVLEGLASLRDKSLIQQNIGALGDTRFSMLETIREYAAERLCDSGEREKIIESHALYYAKMAEEDPVTLNRRLGLGTYSAILHEEYGNLRAAMRRALEAGDVQTILRIGATQRSMWDYLPLDARVEGARWLEHALEIVNHGDLRLRARALSMLGYINARIPGRTQAAEVYLEQGLDILRALGEQEKLQETLIEMAGFSMGTGRYERTQALYEEALLLAREREDQLQEGRILFNLGSLYSDLGEQEKAEEFTREAIALAAVTNSKGLKAFCGINLATIEMWSGNYQRAQEIVDDSTEVLQEFGPSHFSAWGPTLKAQIATRQGDLDTARVSILESMAILKEYHEDEAVIDMLEATAELQMARQLWEEAAELLGAVSALREVAIIPVAPVDQAQNDKWMADLLENLDEKTYKNARHRGEILTREEVLASILETLEAD